MWNKCSEKLQINLHDHVDAIGKGKVRTKLEFF